MSVYQLLLSKALLVVNSTDVVDSQREKTRAVHSEDRRTRRWIRRIVRWVGVLLIAYWVGAFILTHMPIDNERSMVAQWKFPHMDKVVHMAIFTGLSFLASVWFGVRRKITTAIWVSAIVFVLLAGYAAFDELTQGAVGRDPDLKDWFADLAGINLGLFGFFGLRRILRRRLSTAS